MHLPDDRVFLSIQSGDKKALEMLFNTYYDPLCRYANSYLHDPDEAEEIVQNSFLRIWEKRKQLSIETSVKSYLYQIVRNACLNEIKHQKVKKLHGESVMNEGEQHYESSDQQTLRAELSDRISAAIEKLPGQCQVIFRMSRFEELKYQEIANQLNLSIKTVENQMGKALRIMREELKDYLPLIAIFFHLFLEL
jgi:RNA polymerase sigma-70 factor (ECF subfamily)